MRRAASSGGLGSSATRPSSQPGKIYAAPRRSPVADILVVSADSCASEMPWSAPGALMPIVTRGSRPCSGLRPQTSSGYPTRPSTPSEFSVELLKRISGQILEAHLEHFWDQSLKQFSERRRRRILSISSSSTQNGSRGAPRVAF